MGSEKGGRGTRHEARRGDHMTDSPLYWHIHHDILAEPSTEPIENRIWFIKNNEPYHEFETRLRLMKPVRGKLPELDKARAEWGKAYAEFVKARAEWDKAYAECVMTRAEWNKAYAEWNKARAEWDKARAEWDNASADPAVLSLHAKECPNCLWNGRTILPS